MSKLKEQIEDIENMIRDNKEKSRRMLEKRAIDEIKQNPKAFYCYPKKKSVIKTKIGPFFINGEAIREEKRIADILSVKYEKVCSFLLEDITSNEFISKLEEVSDNNMSPTMNTVNFSYETTKKVISKLCENAAMGPDGLPVPYLSMEEM